LVEQIEECRKEIIKSSKKARLTSTSSEESLQRKLILNSQLWKAKELELLIKNLENSKSSKKILEDKIQDIEDRIRAYVEEDEDIELRIIHAESEISNKDIVAKDRLLARFLELNTNYHRTSEEMDIISKNVKSRMGGKLREVDALLSENKLMERKGLELDTMMQQQRAVMQQLVSEQEKQEVDKTKEKLDHIARVESMKLEWMKKLGTYSEDRGRDTEPNRKQSKDFRKGSPEKKKGNLESVRFHDVSQGVDLLDEEEGLDAGEENEESPEGTATLEKRERSREDQGNAKLVSPS
jgi:cell division septum initiation protein DivIVA